MLRKFRYILEYAALRMAIFLVRILPLRTAVATAARLGHTACLFLPHRVKIARDNILGAGITDDPAEAMRIARASFSHFAALTVEHLRAAEIIGTSRFPDCITFEIDPEAMEIFNDATRGVISITGHIGNWEIGGRALSRLKPTLAIARKMNNPYVNRLMRPKLEGDQLEFTPKTDTSPKRLLTALREGKTLGILMDQHARHRAIVVDFLGRPAATHRSPALLHRRTGCPFIVVSCVRTGPLRFLFRASKPITFEPQDNKEAYTKAILLELHRHLEAVIREYPEQYLWAHRRWKVSA